MKSILQKLCFGICAGIALLGSSTASGQIDYLQNFASEDHGWAELDFYTTDVAVCGTDMAFRANLVNSLGVSVPVEALSPSLGISNGEVLTLRYRYKLLDYDSVLPAYPVDDADWGFFVVEYGPTRNGPWTEVDAITPNNHTVTADCITREVRFTPAEGSEVYLRIWGDAGTSLNANYFVYIDDVSAYQETLAIEPLLTRNVLEANIEPGSDFLEISYDGFITDLAIFDMQGQQVEIEDLDNNLTRLDVSGLPYGSYILKVMSEDNIYTTTILKR